MPKKSTPKKSRAQSSAKKSGAKKKAQPKSGKAKPAASSSTKEAKTTRTKGKGKSFFKRFLIFLLVLFVFWIAGIWKMDNETLLQKADAKLGIHILQPIHNTMTRTLKTTLKQAGPALDNGRKFLENRTQPEKKVGAKKQPNNPVIKEKRPSGKTIKRLKKLGKPMGTLSDEDEKLLDDLIDTHTKK